MKVLQSVFVLVLWTFSWSAFAGVYDINIAGSFDDLVATNGEYHLDGLCSKGDMYGYEISLFTENQMVVDNIITNAKVMYVANYSDDIIRIKSIPPGVQVLTLRYDVDVDFGQTNSTVVSVSIDRQLPRVPNTVKNILSAFPSLQALQIELGYNGSYDGWFDMSECAQSSCLRQLDLSSLYPLKNLDCLSRLKMLDLVKINFERGKPVGAR